MRRLIAVLALCAGPALAADSYELAIEPLPGPACNGYIGTFDGRGYLGPTQVRPIVQCKISRHEPARCTVYVNYKPLPEKMEFEGMFIIDNDDLIISTRGVFGPNKAPLSLQVRCMPGLGCYRIEVMNRSNLRGFACDMTNIPLKPDDAPKKLEPPPLLKRPTPEKKFPAEKSDSFST